MVQSSRRILTRRRDSLGLISILRGRQQAPPKLSQTTGQRSEGPFRASKYSFGFLSDKINAAQSAPWFDIRQSVFYPHNVFLC